MNQLNEMLNILITREEELQRKIPKRERATYSVVPITKNKGTHLQLYIGDEDEETLFVSYKCKSYPIVMTPLQMKNFIENLSERWGKELLNRRKQFPNESLYETILNWLIEHPKIFEKIEHELREISIYNSENDPFDLEKEVEVLNTTWLSFITAFLKVYKIFYSLIGNSGIFRITNGKIVSQFDQVLVQFREMLGVNSLKEIKTMESAIGYLTYRYDWIISKRKKIEDELRERYELYDEAYQAYFYAYPQASLYDFFSSIGGIDGELWASYDEFIHDEWIDDNYSLKYETNGSLYDDKSWMRELYDKMRRKERKNELK